MKIDLFDDVLDVGFARRPGAGGKKSDADVCVNIQKENKGRKEGLISYSISRNAADKLGKSGDTFFTKVYEKNGIFRIYFLQNVRGYKLTAFNGEKGRLHLRIPPIDSTGKNVVQVFEKYVGEHVLEYDEENNRYFISVKKGSGGV